MDSKILVVDDEADRREIIRSYVADLGMVLVADGADPGIAAIDCFIPDIVLTDLKMPGKNGMHVVRRAKTSGILVALMTAHPEMELHFCAEDLRDFRSYDLMVKLKAGTIGEQAREAALDLLGRLEKRRKSALDALNAFLAGKITDPPKLSLIVNPGPIARRGTAGNRLSRCRRKGSCRSRSHALVEASLLRVVK